HEPLRHAGGRAACRRRRRQRRRDVPVRRRAAPTITTVVEGDDLGADWERWADGRAHRLKRKRHFADVDPGLARDAAEAAAARMGKAVRTTRDKMMPEKYMWVQFADHCVGPGEPCPCGIRPVP